MNMVAILLDGPPSNWMFVRLLLLCLGAPVVTMLASNSLIGRKKHAILWCLAIAVVGDWGIYAAADALINFGYPYEPSWLVRLGPVIAAVVPFCAIVTYIAARKKPHHVPRPTPTIGHG